MTRKTLAAAVIVPTVAGLVLLLKPSSSPEVKSSKAEIPGELITLKAVPTPNDEASASGQFLVPAGGHEPERKKEPRPCVRRHGEMKRSCVTPSGSVPRATARLSGA
jgi:hypothetical protein